MLLNIKRDSFIKLLLLFFQGKAEFFVAVLNVPVTNAGQMDGDEIVQVYVRNLQDPYGPKA